MYVNSKFIISSMFYFLRNIQNHLCLCKRFLTLKWWPIKLLKSKIDFCYWYYIILAIEHFKKNAIKCTLRLFGYTKYHNVLIILSWEKLMIRNGYIFMFAFFFKGLACFIQECFAMKQNENAFANTETQNSITLIKAIILKYHHLWYVMKY